MKIVGIKYNRMKLSKVRGSGFMFHSMVPIAFLFILLLSGCGGGSNVSATAPSAQVRPIITSILRTFANGDNIQYSVTDTGGFLGGGGAPGISTLTGTGSYSTTINTSVPDPTGVKRSVLLLIASSATGAASGSFSASEKSYFTQTASGTMNFYGNSFFTQAPNWITIPVAGFVPNIISPITVGTNWVNNFTQNNGDTTTQTVTVLRKSTVATGMGSFETYQVQTSSTTTYAAGGTEVATETDYIVPSIGPVKIVVNTTATSATGGVSSNLITYIASTTNIAF